MIGELRHEHVRKQAGARPGRGGSACSGAGAWPIVSQARHENLRRTWRMTRNAAGHVVQHLGDVLAERPQCAAATRAGAGRRRARSVSRAGAPAAGAVPALCAPRRQRTGGPHDAASSVRSSLLLFEILERQRQLRDLGRDLLRRAAELHPSQPGSCSRIVSMVSRCARVPRPAARSSPPAPLSAHAHLRDRDDTVDHDANCRQTPSRRRNGNP